MTANQIAVANLRELVRSHQANEQETHRTNVANEAIRIDANAINKAHYERQDAETQRHNIAVERETNRHNVVTESQTWASIDEQKRHNLETEQQGRESLAINRYSAETSRISVNEQARHNKVVERETARHNIVTENISGRAQSEQERYNKVVETQKWAEVYQNDELKGAQADNYRAQAHYTNRELEIDLPKTKQTTMYLEQFKDGAMGVTSLFRNSLGILNQ